jgi:hypothetical protein
MGCDFSMFLPQPGVDPLVAVRTKSDEESDEINPGPPVPEKEARKQSIARALMKTNTALTIFQFDFDEVAKFESITPEEARVRIRHIELNGPDGGNGIQIELFDDGASLTVPYWHKDEKAKAVFAEIWDYLKVVHRVAGYQIYDPQMDCIVDLASGLDKPVERYLGFAERIR